MSELSDHFNLLYSQGFFGPQGVTQPQLPEVGPIEGFAKSTFSAGTRELIGLDPSQEAQAFRQQHPVGGIASSLLGFGLPAVASGGVGAALRLPVALSKLPYIGRVAALSVSPQTSPAVRAATQTVLDLMPLEFGRLGIAALAGDPARVAGEIPFTLGGSALAGGAIAKVFRSMGGVDVKAKGLEKIRQTFQDFDLNEAPQLQLRKILNYQHADDDVVKVLNDTATQLRRQVLHQEPRNMAPIQKLEFGGDSKNLSTLFRTKEGKFNTKTISMGKSGFGKDSEAFAAAFGRLRSSGFPADFEPYVLLPRIVDATSDTGSNYVRRVLSEMTPVPNKTWIAREENGLFVMAKQLYGRASPPGAKSAGKAAKAGDQFVIFKTDSPEIFVPGGEVFKATVGKKVWNISRQVQTKAESQMYIGRRANEIIKSMPDDIELTGLQPQQQMSRMLTRYLPEAVRDEVRGTTRFLSGEFRRIMSPGIRAFRDFPPASRVWSISRALMAEAEGRAFQLFRGKRVWGFKPESGMEDYLTYKGTIGGELFKAPKFKGGVAGLIDALDDTTDDLAMVLEARMLQMTPQEAKAAGASGRVLKLLRGAQKVNDVQVRELQIAQAAGIIPENTFSPIPQHYGISNTFKGTFRVQVTDEADNVIGIGTGRDAKEALDEAAALVKFGKDQFNMKFSFDKSKIVNSRRDMDLTIAQSVNVGSRGFKAYTAFKRKQFHPVVPARFAPPENIPLGGSLSRTGRIEGIRPITKQDLADSMFGNILETERYLAEVMIKHKMGSDISRVMKLRPDLGEQLMDRLNKLAGRRGDLNAKLEGEIDKVLAPVFGSNAASKMLSAANETMFTWTLGAGDVGFGALNALGVIQTVLPELSLMMTAPPERLAGLYSYSLIGKAGSVVPVAHMSPLKIMKRAVEYLTRPGRAPKEVLEDFKRGAIDGTLAPRLVEEFAGETSRMGQNISSFLKGKGGFTKFLREANKFIPAKSEELARTTAFLSGEILSRDVLGLTGEAAYQLAREFTESTMYLYSQAARPQVLTGPVGGLFALFKNWPFHFVSQLATYSGEAFRGNFKPLLWTMGGTGIIGGAAAVPFFGVAESASRLFTDKSLIENVYSMFGYGTEGEEEDIGVTKLVDSFFYGLPAFMGATLQSRAEVPGSEMMRNVNQLFSSALLDRASFLGQAVGETFDVAYITGQKPFDDQRVTDLWSRALLPRTLYRAMSAAGERGLRSLRNQNLLVSDLSIPQKIAYATGITPLDVQKSLDATTLIYENQDEMRKITHTLGRRLAVAMDEGDTQEITNIYRAGIRLGVPFSGISASGFSNRRNQTIAVLDRIDRRQRAVDLRRRLGIAGDLSQE